jgi:hypothetical protein
MRKRLFVVSASFEFVVQAKTEQEAVDHAVDKATSLLREAKHEQCLVAAEVEFSKVLGHATNISKSRLLSERVYGSDRPDLLLSEALEEESLTQQNEEYIRKNQLRFEFANAT